MPVAIEPRSVVAEWEAGYGRFVIHSSSQIPHALMGAVKTTFGLDATHVQVIAPEVGGGFGVKLNVYSGAAMYRIVISSDTVAAVLSLTVLLAAARSVQRTEQAKPHS